VRILHVDTATEFRGGQRQLVLLAAGLARRGHHQAVACPEGAPLRAALPEGVEVIDVPAGGAPTGWPRLRSVARGFEVVAAHTSHAHQACLAVDRPLVVHRRVDFAVGRGWIGRMKYRVPDAFVCVSSAVAGVLVSGGVDERRLIVVHDGVEPPPKAVPADVGPGRVALAVGALVDHKDHATLARAAEGLDARILVAGEGPLRGALAGTALELLGQRGDVPALLSRADVFVHSSKEEGMGQSVAEAMFAGVPVVATRAGGVPEVVGGCGILVPVGDAEALRAGIQQALRGEHPPVADGRARMRAGFSVPVMVAGTEAAYRAVL